MSRRASDDGVAVAVASDDGGCAMAGFVGAMAGGLISALIMAGVLLMRVPACV